MRCMSTETSCLCFMILLSKVSWLSDLSADGGIKNRAKISKLHTISCKIVGCSTPDSSLQKLYNMRTIQMAKKIISDPTHFLHAKYDLLPSGRRHRMPAVRTQRAMKSFIPSSIKLLNHWEIRHNPDSFYHHLYNYCFNYLFGICI